MITAPACRINLLFHRQLSQRTAMHFSFISSMLARRSGQNERNNEQIKDILNA